MTYFLPRNSGIEGTFSKFADNIKLCGTVSELEGRDGIQRDCNRHGICACADLMKFKKSSAKSCM